MSGVTWEHGVEDLNLSVIQVKKPNLLIYLSSAVYLDIFVPEILSFNEPNISWRLLNEDSSTEILLYSFLNKFIVSL